MTPEPGYTVCYRHPKKVAVQNCKLCKQPICTQCASESGDPLFCLPCKQDYMLHGDRLLKDGKPPREEVPPAAAPAEKLESQPEAPRAPFEMGEVTVLDDGTVFQPGATPADAAAVEPSGAAEAEPSSAATAEPSGAVAADTLGAVAAAPSGDVTAAPAVEIVKKRPPSKAEKPVIGRSPHTGVSSQLFYAARYAAAVAAVLAAGWVLVALATKQWTQISVFTLGIAVPWAFYNSTTRKKHLGVRVWTERPPVIFISAASFVITLIFTVAMEFLVRWVIFGNRYPVSDFLQRYFKATDWVFVICGLLLAGLLPFVLKLSADTAAPSLKRKGAGRSKKGGAEKVEKEAVLQPQRKPKEEAEPEAADEIRPGPGKGTGQGSKPLEWR